MQVFLEEAKVFGEVSQTEAVNPHVVTIKDKQGRIWPISLEYDVDGIALFFSDGKRKAAKREELSLLLWEMAQAKLLAEEHRPRPLPRDLDSLVNELTSALEELRETRNADGSDRIDLDQDTVFDAVETADKAIERGNEYLRAPKKA